MALVKGFTKWVLFLASSHEPEKRHVLDLAFGLMCLEAAGVSKDNIYIYIDGVNRALIHQYLSQGSKNRYTALTTSEFFSECKSNRHDDMVMFVSGHGNREGIDARLPITPSRLLQAVKESPNLKNAVIYLGQCFAGIFNHMPVERQHANDVNAIFIGATSLYESLSSIATEVWIGGRSSWSANFFLISVLKWVAESVDVDGDGRRTVMDSYKYAGMSANATHKNIKKRLFVRSLELHAQLKAAQRLHRAKPSSATVMEIEAIEQEYLSELDLRYIHQECWISNPATAQEIEF